jgi:hypothetical protein
LEALLAGVGPFLQNLDLRLRSRDHLTRGLVLHKISRAKECTNAQGNQRDEDERQDEERNPAYKASMFLGLICGLWMGFHHDSES